MRFSASRWRDSLRRFLDSRKRYCPDCRRHWHIAHIPLAEEVRPGSRVALLLVLMSLAPVALLMIMDLLAGNQPLSFFKRQVRDYYDAAYGSRSGEMLMSHWGWLYQGNVQAQDDYLDHAKKSQ